jgi:tetratricopeptide (TPR) repeat protein
MKKYFICALLAAALVPTSCELVDPTKIVNPNLTVGNVLASDKPMVNWLVGLERQLAVVYNNVIVNLEIASDNYQNTRTFYNQNLDGVKLDFQDPQINLIQFTIADLRESALFGLTTVKEADPTTTPDQEAELHFYKGWAELLAGEIFLALPAVPNGPAISSTENITLAIADFQQAVTLTTNASAKAGYFLALARAYYNLGDKANARTNAQSAIAAEATFTRTVRYDGVNALANTMQAALFARGSFDDLQPLPRLDFLDPKYSGPTNEQAPITCQKIEEAHLILAEAALADGTLTDAKDAMKNAITVANTRSDKTFNDSVEDRPQPSPPAVAAGDRPDKTDILVSASATDPLRAGLVLNRKAGNVTVPIVSGTSLSAADVELLATVDQALEALYLLRQEIFIAEGRRMIDLGIKFPVSEVEALSNSNITEANKQGFAPTFIPSDMDAFTYSKAAKTVIIKHNMNKVLVANKTSPNVLPFH